MIDDKQEFFKKLGINLLLVIGWFGTLFLLRYFFPSNSDSISILELLLGIVLGAISIAIIYYGTIWTVDITDVLSDRYNAPPFNILESFIFFIVLNIFILLVIGRFYPMGMTYFNTYFMKIFFGFKIPMKIFALNNIIFYILLVITGGLSLVEIILKARDNYIKYMIPLIVIMLLCGLVNMVGLISLLVIAYQLIKRIILLIVLVIVFIIISAIGEDSNTSKSVIKSKNLPDKEVYYSSRDSKGSIYIAADGERYHVTDDGKVSKDN